MSIQVLPLVAQFRAMRPDLDGSTIEYHLLEATRDVCRMTFLAKEEVTLTVTDAATSWQIVPTSGNSVLLIDSLSIKCLGHGVLGDLDYVAPDEDFEEIYPITTPILAGGSQSTGRPSRFNQHGATLRLNPLPDADYTVMATISVSPDLVKDLDALPLPEIAMNTLLSGARGKIMALPGPMREFRIAEAAIRDFRRAIGSLRAHGKQGDVGEVPMHVPKLAGIP